MNKKQSNELPFIICHRGASAYAPENTMAAFDSAYKMGGRWVECDVRFCGSGELIVFHDKNLKAFTHITKHIRRWNYEHLAKINIAGDATKQYGEQNIPLLRNLLPYLARRGLKVNLELKTSAWGAKRLASSVIKEVETYWPHQSALPLFSSFSICALRSIYNTHKNYPLAMLMHRWSSRKIKIAQKLNCFSVNIKSTLVTQERVEYLHAMGFKVMVYTINSKKQALHLRDIGVDSIFTDYPDLLTKD